jgi:hypothetical protein
MQTHEEIYGPAISTYTRAQAIADGVLVDVSNVLDPCPFKYPVAITRAAYLATIAAGGTWTPGETIHAENPDAEYLRLPGGQDERGRLHDLFTFNGARTGRPTGNGPQPTNLPSGGPEVVQCAACGHFHGTHTAACPWCITFT